MLRCSGGARITNQIIDIPLMLPIARRAWSTPLSPLYRSIRGLKFLAQDYPPSPGFQKYSEELETALAHSIKRIPPSERLFQKADGTPRNPEDLELQTAAALGALNNQSRATFMDKFRMSQEQSTQYEENSALLEPYFLQGRRVLDKIPVEDPNTGVVTWQVIHEGQKEGWEPIMYYLYVPGLLAALGLYFFLDKTNLSDWALEELRLRAQEKHGDTLEDIADPVERKKRDDLVVERIISGDYDRLAGLKKKASDLPSSLL